MLSYTCVVEGKVTGGNFQSWVQDMAQQLGLTGWVRNIADHKAEILLQGNADQYSSFREHLLAEAPIVDRGEITCNTIEYDKVFDVFEIRGCSRPPGTIGPPASPLRRDERVFFAPGHGLPYP